MSAPTGSRQIIDPLTSFEHEPPADTQAYSTARFETERSGASRCPFAMCDGSGFVFDADTNTAFDCRCRPQVIAQAKARSLSAVIPRR
ncbi:MAG TPA: hypothetical protein VE983_04720, partial [Solirubrobacteraceae bacterium]|nr:hypothetical protein [Solirubrobacteraceae bacterium]